MFQPVRDGDLFALFRPAEVEQFSEAAMTALVCSNLPVFGQILNSLFFALFRDRRAGDGVLISFQVASHLLGIPPNRKPGDVDLLIVPFVQGAPDVENSIAIEVKVARAKYAARSRSAGSWGTKQVAGLVKCGFPWVGLIHLIAVREGAPLAEHRELMAARVLDSDGKVEFLGPRKVDVFPMEFAERSFGRLAKADIPDCVGTLAISLELGETPSIRAASRTFSIFGSIVPLWSEAKKNPRVEASTIKAVERLVTNQPNRFRLLPWYPRPHKLRDQATLNRVCRLCIPEIFRGIVHQAASNRVRRSAITCLRK